MAADRVQAAVRLASEVIGLADEAAEAARVVAALAARVANGEVAPGVTGVASGAYAVAVDGDR
ncbi:hypothetical protein GCM10027184_28330 [Saccharothrix stipae]